MQQKIEQHLNNCLNDDTIKESDQALIKFLKRVSRLQPGRYEIVLSVSTGLQDWTIREIGKIEKP